MLRVKQLERGRAEIRVEGFRMPEPECSWDMLLVLPSLTWGLGHNPEK